MTNQTNQTNALTVIQPRPLTPQVWSMIEAIAPAIHQSRMFGVSSAAGAAAIMLKSYELGFPMTAGFDLIHLIATSKGVTPSLSPRGALALLHSSPIKETIELKRLTDNKGNFTGYECRMKRVNGFEHTVSFTLEDAKRAGLIKAGGAWETYPENMCKWRAIGFAADVVFPDVLGGMKTADQLGAELTPDGDVIEGSWSASAPLAAEENALPEWQITLQNLLTDHGAEAVLEANEGKIPATEDEVRAVQKALAMKVVEQVNGELFGDPA